MVFTSIGILTSIAIVLLVGVLVSLFATRFRIPEAFMLILTGLLLGYLRIGGEPIIEFPSLFITTAALLALAMIIFDGSARIKLSRFDQLSTKALRLALTFIFFEMVLLSLVAKFFLGIPIPIAILFAALVSGTASEVLTTAFGDLKNKIVDVIKFESIINTPLTVIIPFVVLDIITSFQGEIVASVLSGVLRPLLIKVVAGIGSGALLFVLLYKIIGGKHNKIYTPLSVILSAILAFVIAENIGGDGVLSVTTLGLLFGNFLKKKHPQLLQYESLFSKALFILIFVLIGLVISLPFSAIFIWQSFALFLVYVVIRFIAVSFSLPDKEFSFKERLFATCQSAKGVTTATVVLTFALLNVPSSPLYLPDLGIVLNIALMFILYSLALSAVTIWMSSLFLDNGKKKRRTRH